MSDGFSEEAFFGGAFEKGNGAVFAFDVRDNKRSRRLPLPRVEIAAFRVIVVVVVIVEMNTVFAH